MGIDVIPALAVKELVCGSCLIGDEATPVNGVLCEISGTVSDAILRGLQIDCLQSGTDSSSLLDIKGGDTGSNNADHIVAVQARPTHLSTGTLNEFFGLFALPTNSGGTITKTYSIYASDPLGAGTSTNAYGVYIEPITHGGTTNFNIYSDGGYNWMSGDTEMTRNTSGATRPVLKVHQDHASNTEIALDVTQDGAADGIQLTHTNATGYGLDITHAGTSQYAGIRSVNSTTSGHSAWFEKNVASSSQPAVYMIQNHTSGGQPVLTLDQDDTSEGFIDFVGTDTGAIATSTTNSDASVTVELNGTKYKVPLYTV